MSSVLLVTHIFLAVALVIVVLLQRAESNSLGSIGGGGNTGAVTPQGTSANPLWRVTTYLAAFFMLTSLGLAFIASHRNAGNALFDKLQAESKSLAAPASPPAPKVAGPLPPIPAASAPASSASAPGAKAPAAPSVTPPSVAPPSVPVDSAKSPQQAPNSAAAKSAPSNLPPAPSVPTGH